MIAHDFFAGASDGLPCMWPTFAGGMVKRKKRGASIAHDVSLKIRPFGLHVTPGSCLVCRPLLLSWNSQVVNKH